MPSHSLHHFFQLLFDFVQDFLGHQAFEEWPFDQPFALPSLGRRALALANLPTTNGSEAN